LVFNDGSVFCFFQDQVQVLVESFEATSEAFTAFQADEHNFTEVLFKDFGCHFAHIGILKFLIASILEFSPFKPI